MDIESLIEARHSVRAYKAAPIEQEKRDVLNSLVDGINRKAALHIQILYDEPKCFDAAIAHYGRFTGVRNYIALVGAKSRTLDETLGYFGEEIVLKAQELGLNTCWVALTHGKSAARVDAGEAQRCLIAVGYGATSGASRRSKSVEQVSNYKEGMPPWFLRGVKAALAAPTAVNQQKFYFELKDDDSVTARRGAGFYSAIDLGIARYHFEAVTGKAVG